MCCAADCGPGMLRHITGPPSPGPCAGVWATPCQPAHMLSCASWALGTNTCCACCAPPSLLSPPYTQPSSFPAPLRSCPGHGPVAMPAGSQTRHRAWRALTPTPRRTGSLQSYKHLSPWEGLPCRGHAPKHDIALCQLSCAVSIARHKGGASGSDIAARWHVRLWGFCWRDMRHEQPAAQPVHSRAHLGRP